MRYAADDAFIPIENTPEASARWSEVTYSKGKRRPVDQWRPSIFLPRWASRITLDVVDLRVERLHEIDDVDAAREGVAFAGRTTNLGPREDFAPLWDAINGERVPWRLNPWVWRIEFRRVEGPGDPADDGEVCDG